MGKSNASQYANFGSLLNNKASRHLNMFYRRLYIIVYYLKNLLNIPFFFLGHVSYALSDSL